MYKYYVNNLFLPLLFLIFCVLTTYGLAYSADVYEKGRTHTFEENRLKENLNRLRYEIQYAEYVAETFASFFQASDEVTNDEFDTFARRLLEFYPPAIGFAWAPVVAAQDRSRFLETARAEIIPNYEIWRVGGANNDVKDVSLDIYPVYYLAMRKGSREIYGMDMGSNSARRQTIEMALQTDQVQTSNVVDLVTLREETVRGFLLVKRTSPNGFAGQGVFVAALELYPLIKRSLIDDSTAVVKIEDMSAGPDQKLIYMSDDYDQYQNKDLTISRVFALPGQTWSVSIIPKSAFDNLFAGRELVFWVILLAGLIMSLGLFLFIIHQIQRRELIEKKVDRRTKNLKQKTIELEQNQQFLNRILTSTTEGIYGTDENGKILFVNDTACELLGFQKVDLLNMDEDDFLSRIRKDEASHFQPRHFYNGIELKRKDGEIFLANFKRNRIESRENKNLGFVGFVQDVTEVKKEEFNERERQKLESLGRLAGGVAHEINNILQTITLTAELAIDSDEPLPQETQNDLQYIIENTSHAASIARDILSFSRLEGHDDILAHDLVSVVESTEKFLKKLLAIEVDVRFITDLNRLNVRMDPVEMKQILINLSLNAAHAMNNEGEITISLSEENNQAFLRVMDTGSGIPLDIQSRIFEPFFTTKKMGEGTGLGLSIVRNILVSWNGNIAIEKTSQDGTTFLITLPVDKV